MSEQEKVVGIKSYEGLSVYFEPCVCFWVEMGIFALKFFKNDMEILHTDLYVFGSYVWEKGEGVRTRKGCWHKKL